MSQALSYIYYIYSGFLNLVFTDMQISEGVTFGYVCLSVLLIVVIIHTVVFLPRGAKIDLYKKVGDED